jgi:undecaprenyl diphosphate synthase
MDAGAGIPKCVGFIMDGNRRWAVERGLSTLRGHEEGVKALKRTVRAAQRRGIRHVVAFAFSTENWNRPENEISYLMRMIERVSRRELSELSRDGIRMRFIGVRDMLPPFVVSAIETIEKESVSNTGTTLWICLSYGGQQEIIAAARALCERVEDITEESLRRNMWTGEMPDPDIIVRTGGAQRLSNFLLWQSAYSELFFIDTYWPDFNEETLDAILDEYTQRERRHGK